MLASYNAIGNTLCAICAHAGLCFGLKNLESDMCAPQGGGGAGKKQVAAMLGVQTLRASTRPRPFLRLSPQHLAVQVRIRRTLVMCARS